MCDLTDIEFPSIYTETKRKANKEHVCLLFSSLIVKGIIFCFGDLWEAAGLLEGELND